jgi:hypothetical protein
MKTSLCAQIAAQVVAARGGIWNAWKQVANEVNGRWTEAGVVQHRLLCIRRCDESLLLEPFSTSLDVPHIGEKRVQRDRWTFFVVTTHSSPSSYLDLILM